MSHEIDMSNDRANMAYAGEVPWHGLGQELEAGADLETWAEAAGLNWEARKAKVQFDISEQGEPEVMEDRLVLYRSDTHAPLGIVSPGYKIVQPADVLEFYRNLVEDHGFVLETAGCLYEGKKIWALANTREAVNIAKRDELRGYVLLATSFDGSLATTAQHTSVRVVCNNTLSVATGDKTGNRATFNHRGEFDVDTTQQLLGIRENWELFAEYASRMLNVRFTRAEAIQFFLNLFYTDPANIDLNDGKAAQSLNRALAAYDDQPGGSETLWGAVNAITFLVDHNSRARSDDSRLGAAWFGQGNSLKVRAWQAALDIIDGK